MLDMLYDVPGLKKIASNLVKFEGGNKTAQATSLGGESNKANSPVVGILILVICRDEKGVEVAVMLPYESPLMTLDKPITGVKY